MSAEIKKKYSITLIVIITLFAGAIVFLQNPFAQDPDYHNFADDRIFLYIKNFYNVLSNIFFIIPGVLGISFVFTRGCQRCFASPFDRWIYFTLFFSVFLIGLGSSYYHYNPNNFTLLWDRLPIAVASGTFFSIVFSERINHKTGVILFWILLGVSTASVLYWYFTESAGVGDLRIYFFMQFFPMLSIPLMVFLFHHKFEDDKYFYLVTIFFILSKVPELLDREIFSVTSSIVSGHTLKHLISGVAILMIYLMLRYRSKRVG